MRVSDFYTDQPVEQCVAERCERPPKSRGTTLCHLHYHRVRRAGRLEATVRTPTGRCHRCGEPTTSVFCSRRCETRERRGVAERGDSSCPMCGASIDRSKRADATYCNIRCARAAGGLRTKYGLTPAEYQAIRQRQQSRCAVCGDDLGPSAHVDHDHRSGQVRGILCAGCNLAIGHLRDDPTIASAAAKYLRRHQAPAGANPSA